MRGFFTLGALVLAGLTSCGDAGLATAPEEGASAGALSSVDLGRSGGLPPFLSLVEGSQDSNVYRGVRRVRTRRGTDWLDVREDVGCDGAGHFAVELNQQVSLTPDLDPFAFEIMFESAARFQWKMRDFRIRGLDRAAQNYAITVLPSPTSVAGIVCVRVEFIRHQAIGGRPGHYQADIDSTTGMVLAWREFDELGDVIVESEYESFQYGGDTSDLTLRGRTFVAAPLTLGVDMSSQAGIPIRYPDIIPKGFEVLEAELMEVPASLVPQGTDVLLRAGSWVRFQATDGIESIGFAHSDVVPGTPVQAGQLNMLRVGSWEVGFGSLDATRFVVAGRLSEAEIRLIIQAAF